jgi:hypothetical protein
VNRNQKYQQTRWVHTTREASGDIFGDSRNQHHTHSKFQQASLLAQVSKVHDTETFAKASGHPNWDTAMIE